MATHIQYFYARRICKLCFNFPASRNTVRFYVPTTSEVQQTLQKTDAGGSCLHKLEIPKRRKRDDLAVLRALSETVRKDPTASPYSYHDDPYLLPKTPMERKRYLLAADSGKKAAQLVIKTRSHVFLAHQHDEPKIEAYYPPTKMYVFTDPSEDGILERLEQLDLKSASDMHKQLRDSGKEVSLDVSNGLLDALCFYNSQSPLELVIDVRTQPPVKEEKTDDEVEKQEEIQSAVPAAVEEKRNIRRGQQDTWKEGEENKAQLLFESLQEPDSHSYNAMVKGMVKHGAHGKAFNIFNEMQEKGIQTSLEGYNALISAVTSIRTDYKDRWEVLVQLLKQMQAENVHPNVITFNNLLNGLRLMGAIGRKKALHTLSEMRVLNIEPSLGTYSHLLTIFYKDSLPPNDILYDIMDTIDGEEFSYQDPNDVNFFKNAMNICFNLKDVRLAYQIDDLLNTGNNHKLCGDNSKQSLYYSRFLHLICLMDSADAMFEYYEKLVPSGFIPNGLVFMDMMRSIQTAGSFEKLPFIWKDMCMYGLRYRQEGVELLLQVTATAESIDRKQMKELTSLAEDIEKAFEESQSRRDQMRWNTLGLTNLLMVYIRAGNVDKAWATMKMYEKLNMTPGQAALEDFITLCGNAKNLEKAIECLDIAIQRSLAFSPALAEKIRQHPDLTVQQSNKITEILEGEDFNMNQT